MKKVCVTGVAGFIGFHLAERLLQDGYAVVGVDSLEPYYDVRIKRRRLEMLRAHRAFSFHKLSIADFKKLRALLEREKPAEVVHLAAQAGVRYSLTNPWAYATSNYLGTLNVFEASKQLHLPRVVYASSSSVYGSNKKQPFSETDRTDQAISIYGASKKANEILAHSYYDMYGMEMVGLRFFTVYGPWGRPDLALFKFVRLMLQGKPLELYNRGNMARSFTHVDDVVEGIVRILKKTPAGRYRLYNLGGAQAVPLKRFVELIERNLGMKAQKTLLPLQAGDVKETVADTGLARKELGYMPKKRIEEGIEEFVEWFVEHKRFLLSLKEPKQ